MESSERLSLQLDTTPILGPDADLPSAPPLSHDLFLASDFEADSFLLERRHGSSLDDLRSELRQYLAELRNELVGVINEDYEDFIGLGVSLRGTDKRLDRMRRPVENVRLQIETTRSELVELQTAIQAKLDQRAAVREQKATIRLLLSINDSVLKVEALLLIQSPVDPDQPVASSSGTEKHRSASISKRNLRSSDIDKSGAKRVERVAAEYNQLLYLMEKARGLAFVDTLEMRVEQIRRTLQRDMSTLLSNALHAAPPSPDSLYDVLKIFQGTRKVHEAEEVVRKELIRPWLHKHVTRDALSVPLSPLPVRAPKPSEAARSPPPVNGLHVNGLPQSALDATPSSTLDPLVQLYNHILGFVTRDCAVLLDIADRRLRFSMLVNVVWEEILNRLMTELGHIIFAAGRADTFHSNCVATTAFFSHFEGFCISQKQLLALRANKISESFHKRWQRPVYYQLRFKEIVSRLEESLESKGGLDHRASNTSPFLLTATEATHRAIWTCWQPDVILPELAPRFWRLTLQLLSRYKRWLDDAMPPYLPSSRRPSMDAGGEATNRLAVASLPSSRSITPQPELSEEVVVRYLTLIVADTRRLREHSQELFNSLIKGQLDVGAEIDAQPSAAFEAAATSISAVAPSLLSQIVAALVRQCNEPLRPSLRSVVSEVRASNKASPPSTPSHLVPRIFKPLKAYFDTFPGKTLDTWAKQQIAGDVLDEIAARYASVLNDNREAEASLRRLKKGRQGFSLFGRGSATEDSTGVDESNVKVQLQIDVDAFSSEAKKMGVTVDEARGFAALRQAIQ